MVYGMWKGLCCKDLRVKSEFDIMVVYEVVSSHNYICILATNNMQSSGLHCSSDYLEADAKLRNHSRRNNNHIGSLRYLHTSGEVIEGHSRAT